MGCVKGRSVRKALAVIAGIAAFSLLGACGGAEKASDAPLKIGYVVNYMSHEWYQNICSAAEDRAAELGVEILIADANLDVAAQISKAENFMAQQVDVLVLTPVDSKALGPIVKQAKAAGIRVITESNPVPGSDTYVGIDNRASGYKAGQWFAAYAKAQGIDAKILIIGLPNFDDCRQRVDGFKAALSEAGLAAGIVQEVDGQGMKEKAFKVAQDALTAHPEINVIYGINDDSTTGGMAAYKAAGLDESVLTAIGFGLEGIVGQSALLGGTPYKAALAMFPDFVGASLVDAAVALGKGETLPPHYETPTIVLTPDNFPTFYDKKGEGYAMKFDAIRKLMR
jgi:ribose transport system substrate-binding protein